MTTAHDTIEHAEQHEPVRPTLEVLRFLIATDMPPGERAILLRTFEDVVRERCRVLVATALDGLMALGAHEGNDDPMPLFSEMVLYEKFGKDHARTILVRLERLAALAGEGYDPAGAVARLDRESAFHDAAYNVGYHMARMSSRNAERIAAEREKYMETLRKFAAPERWAAHEARWMREHYPTIPELHQQLADAMRVLEGR